MRTLLASQLTLILLNVLVDNAEQTPITIDVWSAIDELRVKVELVEAKMNEGFASVALNLTNMLKVRYVEGRKHAEEYEAEYDCSNNLRT